MQFKGPRNSFHYSFVKLVPAKFGIPRLEGPTPIGRGLVRGAHPIRNRLLNSGVI